MSGFPASDEMVVWTESLVGMLTKMKTEYGGTEAMLERPDWDESKTEYVISLLGNLKQHVCQIHNEMVQHVSQKIQ